MTDQNPQQIPTQTAKPIGIEAALSAAREDAATHNAKLYEADRNQKQQELIEKLRIAIANSLFLDEKRKSMWLNALHLLDLRQAEELLGAILRENLRYKKNIRKLKFKEIPERVAEEGGEF